MARFNRKQYIGHQRGEGCPLTSSHRKPRTRTDSGGGEGGRKQLEGLRGRGSLTTRDSEAPDAVTLGWFVRTKPAGPGWSLAF